MMGVGDALEYHRRQGRQASGGRTSEITSATLHDERGGERSGKQSTTDLIGASRLAKTPIGRWLSKPAVERAPVGKTIRDSIARKRSGTRLGETEALLYRLASRRVGSGDPTPSAHSGILLAANATNTRVR